MIESSFEYSFVALVADLKVHSEMVNMIRQNKGKVWPYPFGRNPVSRTDKWEAEGLRRSRYHQLKTFVLNSRLAALLDARDSRGGPNLKEVTRRHTFVSNKHGSVDSRNIRKKFLIPVYTFLIFTLNL